ncbi:MAG: ABC transporter permease [Bacillota bacterium]|nr:ABC transporter permease [Bacillota bacterium]
MNKFLLILFHTFMTKLKTKSFIITTIVTMVALLGLTNLNRIMDMFNKDSGKEKVAVLDQSGQLYMPLKQQLRIINKDVTLIEYKGTEQEAERAVKKGKLDGYVQIGLNKEKLPEGSFKAMSIAGTGTSSDIQNSLQQLKTAMAASQINLSSVQLQKLYEPVAFKKTALEKNAKTEAELNQARGLVYILLFIIYFAVIMYANMIAMEVATEKSSRVMEILISSVPPIQQMFAKILGVGLLSITQLVLLLSMSYISFKRNMSNMNGGLSQYFGFNEIPVSTLVYAVVFFILGYFLYATLAAFLGSLVSRIEDVQQMITPMTMLILAGFMIAAFGLGKPDAPFITFTSYIPFFAPMIMFLRVGMLNIPFWESLASMAILIATILLLGVFGARVYRGGVLMYGKSNSYKDIKKALQLTKNK